MFQLLFRFQCSHVYIYLPTPVTQESQQCVAKQPVPAACDVCSYDNMRAGYKRFPVSGSDRMFVQCEDVGQCTVEDCGTYSTYMPVSGYNVIKIYNRAVTFIWDYRVNYLHVGDQVNNGDTIDSCELLDNSGVRMCTCYQVGRQ